MAEHQALFNPAQYIQQAFQEVEDPIDAIEAIQKENKIKVPSVQPALCFLDLHGIPREDVYRSLFKKLHDTLITQFKKLEERAMKRLLDKIFQYTAVPDLRPVVMSVLEQASFQIPEKYLLEIAEKEELYSDCPMSVKQQIWQMNPGVFGEAVSPLLDQYISDKESYLFGVIDTHQELTGFLSLPAKTRRQNLILQQLVLMLGTSVPLYNTLCQFLKTLFLRTGVGHYCTLRADLIMILHEQDNEIMDQDRCHKFAWCLDACIRGSSVDEKRLRELYTFLDTIEGGDEVLEDVSMLLRDPYALYAITTSALQTIQKLITEHQLPRGSQYLENLLRILSIGLKSLNYLETKAYTGDPLETDLVVHALPELMSIMVESSLKVAHVKLKQDYPLYTPSSSFTDLLITSPPAMHLTCTYILYLAEKKDFRTLSLVLPTLSNAYIQNQSDIMPDGFMHSLIIYIVTHIGSIKEMYMTMIMKEFFVPCACHGVTVLLYLCRLLYVIHDKMKPDLLSSVLRDIEPSDEVSAVAMQQYQALLDHVQNKQ